MPRRARACVARLSNSVVSKRTAPLALSKPITAFMSVVLPAPLRPMRPIIEPLGTSSDTSRRMRMAVAVLGEAEAPEQVLGDLVRRAPESGHRRRTAGKVAREAGISQDYAEADHHVVEYAERAVKLRDLERAADAQARDVARRQA